MSLAEVDIVDGTPAQLAPKSSRAAEGERTQLLLVPADQRRNKKGRQTEIVPGLDGELHRRKKVLHRKRLVQVQAVDPSHRHSSREKPGDDERRELGPAADEDQDVASCERPAGRG